MAYTPAMLVSFLRLDTHPRETIWINSEFVITIEDGEQAESSFITISERKGAVIVEGTPATVAMRLSGTGLLVESSHDPR